MQNKNTSEISGQTETVSVKKQKPKKEKSRLSLHTFLAMAFIIFTVITSGLLLIEVVFLEKFYYYFKIQETKNIASELIEAYYTDEFEEKMRAVSFSNQICISVIDSRNYVLYQSDVMGNRCLLHGWHNYLFQIQQEVKNSTTGTICMLVMIAKFFLL